MGMMLPDATAADAFTLASTLDPVALPLAAGIVLDPWQQRVVRSTARYQLVNAHRQGGKSLTVAVRCLHQALRVPGSLSVIAAPTLRQASESVRRVRALLAALRLPDVTQDTALAVELANASRILALPGSAEGSVRGYTCGLVVVDEAARIKDELLDALRPMISTTSGALIMVSTPHGRRGAFFESWVNGGDVWERTEVPATACPRITPEFLAAERAAVHPLVYDAEWLCKFTDLTSSFFTAADVAKIFDTDVPSLELGCAV
jgi:hypothetical protein